MNHKLRLTAEKIAKRIALIRPLVNAKRHPIENFRFERLTAADTPVPPDAGQGEVLPWDFYWASADTHFVLRSAFTIPEDHETPALHLPLGNAGDIFTHPEALLYINGAAVASADRYHHTIELPPDLKRGQRHTLLLHGWTGHTDWPPNPNSKTKLFMKPCAVVDLDADLREFIAVAEMALGVANELSEDSTAKDRILTALDRAFVVLDTRDPLGDAMRRTVPAALNALRMGLAASGRPLDVTLHAIGHAHMDVAYLWPIAQIRQKNARTYSNVLRLMDRHEGFRFSHSQPQLYAWTEEDFPDIFLRIKERVAEGRWEILGGMWVEPDVNIPGAEALVRQILLARRYVRNKFGGPETPVLWLPDTFGFPACLPQLMVQAGLKWFVTNKVNWNQYNQMPNSTTWWEGLDGSRVLAQFLTTPREVQHLPFPTNYKSDLSAYEVLGTWRRNTMKSTLRDLMICYGYGDGGGGPTEELIAKANVLTEMPGAPRLKPATVKSYFEKIEKEAHRLPTWSGEMYMEGHRGVLTSQGWIKRANRLAEVALHDAEALLCRALFLGHEVPNLEAEWRLLCTAQFHDILTGTSVTDVFDDARQDFATILEATDRALKYAADKLAPTLPAGTRYLAVTGSPFGAPRQAVVPGPYAPLADAITGVPLQAQAVDGGTLVALSHVGGYGAIPLKSCPEAMPAGTEVRAFSYAGGIAMENPHLRVDIDAEGLVARVLDRARGREVLRARGNRLEVFEDRPVSWDAWDIDIFFDERPELISDVATLSIVEEGPLRAVVEVVRRWRSSTIRQRVVLRQTARRIDFETEIDWRESHFLLKAAFPVTVRSSRATYDIQWGQVERPTHHNTSWDAARFEVPAQKWVDLSEGDYGVALLNNGRYGHDVRGDVLRLSLVKSATMPDPVADQGRHEFTYSLLPHEGDWRGMVVAEAYALNHPVRVFSVDGAVGEPQQDVPIVESTSANVVIETIKPAEDGRGIIVRLFEAHCCRGGVVLRVHPSVASIWRSSLLEEDGPRLPLSSGSVTLELQPYEIATLRLIPE